MRQLTLFLPLLLAACTASGEQAPGSIANADRVPAARVLGPAQRCVSLSQLQNPAVHGAQVIDFRLRNGETWRSTLPAPCPGLAVEQRIAYDASFGQLCDTDMIQVLHIGSGSSVPGARCRLGNFVPVELVGREGDDSAD